MNRQQKMLSAAAAAILLAGAWSCSDGEEEWPAVDGGKPEIALERELIGSRVGQTFYIKGRVADADGLRSIRLESPMLYLDKTINLLEIYDELLTTYDLDYSLTTDVSEVADMFSVLVSVEDVLGNVSTTTVDIDMDGDIDAPAFAVAPGSDIVVLLSGGSAVLPLNFTVADDRALGRVAVAIEGAGYSREITDFGEDATSYVFDEAIALPAANAEYAMTIEVEDCWKNVITHESKIIVSDTPDYARLWLADVATAAELNSDVMGVPMLITRTAPYCFEARYYNEKAGTEVWFLPQRNDFAPRRFGRAADGSLSDAADASPFVLDQAKVYYLFTLDLLARTCDIDTYSPDEAVDPIPHAFGSISMDRWENGGEELTEFWFGYTTQGPSDISRFTQDSDNPHLFTLDTPLALKAGRHSGFIIHNFHPDGWWNYCTWRADDEQDPEICGYYGNFANPLWSGTYAEDKWFKPAIPADGNYDLIFDAHLDRLKIVPAK